MAELHTNIYIRHPNSEIHEQLAGIFHSINDSPKPNYEKIEEILLSNSIKLSPEKGKVLFNHLLSSVKSSYGKPSEDLVAESKSNIAGYHSFHFVHGSSGKQIVKVILQYIGELVPGVDARGCLAGDDDPWEIFYRFENGTVINKYYEPEYDEVEEAELPAIYQWWHDGLPPEIKDGFINEWLEDEE